MYDKTMVMHLVVSGLDHCLTSNLTAVHYSALSILVKSLLAYI